MLADDDFYNASMKDGTAASARFVSSNQQDRRLIARSRRLVIRGMLPNFHDVLNALAGGQALEKIQDA